MEGIEILPNQMLKGAPHLSAKTDVEYSIGENWSGACYRRCFLEYQSLL
ncbi:MAG: hypothetical protein ACRDBO_09595 [Lachnospiraceae bacterium]